MAPLKLYGQGSRVEKVMVVALFAGVELETPAFTAGITNKTPWYLKMNPNGKWPVLQTPSGALFESNVICKYITTIGSNPTLYPQPSSPQVCVALPVRDQLAAMHTAAHGHAAACHATAWRTIPAASYLSGG